MRVLLDHNVPPELRRAFPEEFRVETASYRGWEDRSDGSLLRLKEAEYEALVTLDTSIFEQQDLDSWALGVVVLDVHPIHPENLRCHVTSLLSAVRMAIENRCGVIVTEDSVTFAP
jgi:predicted nuclease of predicted toxin-antitoxin system